MDVLYAIKQRENERSHTGKVLMNVNFRKIMVSKAPPVPAVKTLLVATATSVCGLLFLVFLGGITDHLLLIPPMAASMALVAGAPSLPLAQPRNVIGGQMVSAIVGSAVGLVSHSLWAGAIAGGLALGAMLMTRTSHSPAAATAVIATALAEGQLSFIVCAGIAATALVFTGYLRAKWTKPAYPIYWW